jgi:N-acetylglucosaminyldiphosphoundecaprenol N-acetyl-beta-D-mannosaminyltransferase
MIDRGSHNIVGVRVHAVDYEAAVAKIVDAARLRQPMAVAAVSVHGLMASVRDGAHRYRLNALDLVVPDGQPVRWALNRLYSARLRERVYGPQLMFEVCRGAAEAGLPIFVFGADEAILGDLRRQLQKKLPKLEIAGSRPAKYCQVSSAERDALVEEVRESGARIMLVGLGCPRQEVFVYEMRDILSMPTLAVGAALNFHAGHLPQAPRLLQRYGLEWAFRLASEPRRLWKRYLLHNPPYFWYLGLQATGLYTMNPEDARPPQQEMCYG